MGLGVRIDCKQAQGRLRGEGGHGNVKKLDCGDGYKCKCIENVLKRESYPSDECTYGM